MSHPWTTLAVLGTGRTEPGLKRLDLDSYEVADVAVLDPGASVYSLAREPMGESLAAGTRDGRFYVLPRKDAQAGQPSPAQMQHIRFSAPILATSFVGRDRIIIATRESTFWVPSRDISADCHHLDTHGDFICSLVALSDTDAISVSSQGQVLGWRLPGGECFVRLCGPSPGRHFALVRMVHWPIARCVLYGTAEGALVRVSLDDSGMAITPAHRGELYAVCSSGEWLMTLGKADGVLRLWRETLDEPELETRCRTGVTSAVFLDDNPVCILALDELGRAEVFRVHGNALESVKCLPGDCYRSVIGPAVDEARSWRARTVWADACSRIRRTEFADIERLSHRLEQLGRKDAAIQLRLKMAVARGDVIAEFGLRRELYRLPVKSKPDTREDEREYAQLLVKYCCFREGAEVYQKLVDDGGEEDVLGGLRFARQRAQWLEDPQAIMDAGVDLTTVVDVWTTLRKEFCGRWIVRIGESPAPCRGVSLTAQDVLDEYANISRNNTDAAAGNRETPVIVDRMSASRIDAITFERAKGVTSTRLQLVIHMDIGQSAIYFRPMVVLCALAATPGASGEQHGDAVKAVLRASSGGQSETSWLQRTIHDVCLAIRMAFSTKLAAKDSRI